MAVGDENVFPPIIVVVEELHAKTKKRNADGPDTRRAGQVGELAVVIVVIEVVGIVGEVGFHDIGPAVVIVIRRVNTHAGLLAAINAIGHAGHDSRLCEAALAVVVIKQAR